MCVIAHMIHAADATWKALADPVRREILDLLRTAPRTTGEICDAFQHLTRFGVLNHMSVLKEAGFLRAEPRGRERINHLNPDPLREAYEDWIREYEVLWAGRLGRLKKLVDGKERREPMRDSNLPVANLVTLNIEQRIEFRANATAVFLALTGDIGEWWGQPYLRDDARDIILDPVPGGLVKQLTRDGGGDVMYTVQTIRRDRLLVLNGTMAMSGAIAGSVRFELEPIRNDETRLSLKHWAIGDLSTATQERFAKGWSDLLDKRLRAFVERGEPRGIRAKLARSS
jgi:DNA-binding transcriptional ArsR family regulator